MGMIKPKPARTIQIGVRLSDDVHSQLQAVAERYAISLAEVVRQAIDLALAAERERTPPPPRRRRSARRSQPSSNGHQPAVRVKRATPPVRAHQAVTRGTRVA